LAAPQQAQRQERRQRAQDPAAGHVLDRLKTNRRRLQLAQGSQQPLLQARRRHAQGGRPVGDAPLALVRGGGGKFVARGVFILNCLSRPSSIAMWSVLAKMPNCRLMDGAPAP